MKTKTKALITFILLLLTIPTWKLYTSYTAATAGASFGYDDQGKFIAMSFSKPVFLEKIIIGDEEHIIGHTVGQGYTMRYNWRPRKEYTIRLAYGRGSSLLREKAPALERTLKAEAGFCRASFGDETLAVAEARIFSVENDKIRAYFSPAVETNKVTILRYPPVFTSRDRYENFAKTLADELKKAGIRVRVEKRLEDAEGLIIIANGAWPEGLSTSNRSIYIGALPGEVVVRRDGSLTLGETWEGVTASTSRVDSRLSFKSSAYTTGRGVDAVVNREDGMPGVFRLDNTLVFSNTLDRGWESVEGAVDDVVEAVITGGFGPVAKEEFKLGRDASNFTHITYTRVLDADSWSLTLLTEKGGVRLTGTLEGSGAKIDAPASVYPGEETELKALIHQKPNDLKLTITGVSGGGKGVIEEVSTRGADARRIRAVFPESGLYLVKLLDGERVMGCALVRAKSIDVQAISIEPGARGSLTIRVLEDGKPYTGTAELIVDGRPVLKGDVEDGYLRYEGELLESARIVLLLHGKSYPIEIQEGRGLLPDWVRPYHIALAALALLSAFFSAMIKGRESKVVTIEIPKVWGREEIRAKASEVLKVFELYNRRMRWESLPLTLEEVQRALYLFGIAKGYPDKESLKKLLDKDMNISMPLAERRVAEEQSVALAYGYYAPYKWERDYQSVEHLAMIRVAYEWLIGHGIETKPLTLPSYKDGYPDLLAVTRSAVFKSIFGAAPREGEVVIYVECETGKKPVGNAEEKLVRAFQEKLELIVEEKPEEPTSSEGEEAEGGSKSKEEPATKEKQEGENEKNFFVKKAMLFVLSQKLYDAYETLIESDKTKHKETMEKIKPYITEKQLFVLNIEEIVQ